MKENNIIEHPDLDDLFERYRQAPESHAFVPLADACRKLGRVDEAVEICSKGIALHPDYASGYVVMGKCLFDRGMLEAAEETFRKVLELDASNLVALKFLGLLEAETGRIESAKERFEQILILDPGNKEIRKKVQWIQEIEVEEIEAAGTTPATFEDTDLAPDDEQFEGPVIELTEEFETSDELATLTLADIFASQGYKEKAVDIYNEILRRQPDNEAVMQRIAELSGDEVTPEFREMTDEIPAAGESVDVNVSPNDSAAEPMGVDAPEGGSDSVLVGVSDADIGPADGPPPAEAAEPKSPPQKPEPAKEPEPHGKGRQISDDDSFDYFKRWLGHIGD
jgi:tetratricopeptide (TPR) repeat protein